MKILLYTSKVRNLDKSGIGMAFKHQIKALKLAFINCTTNINDDYDIIHINTVFPDALLMATKAKNNNKKIVFHAHTTEEDFRNSFKFSNNIAPALRKWLIMCYSKADLIITPTIYSKKLLQSYGIKNDITVISNGVDLNFFKKTYEGAKKFRKKYNFSRNDKIIMGVGLYIERKGILEFIELARRMPEYKFIWFGYTEPSLVPNKIIEAMKRKTNNLIFPGYVESGELKNAYSGADVFLFPTKEETEGIVLLEALAMKINTIISDIPIYDEFTDELHLYKAKNIDEFECKIKKIINRNLPNLTEIGYKIALKYDLKKIGFQLKGVYRELLEKKLVKN